MIRGDGGDPFLFSFKKVPIPKFKLGVKVVSSLKVGHIFESRFWDLCAVLNISLFHISAELHIFLNKK